MHRLTHPRAHWRLSPPAPIGLCLGLLAVVIAGCGGGESTEDSSSAFATLDSALQPLREDFEGAYGHYRLVVVVSPSCGNCIENSENLYNQLLPELTERGVEVFYIWGSVLPTDNAIQAGRRVEKLYDPDLRHYFDPSGRVTRSFARMLGMDPGRDAYDIFLLYGPEATWDPQGTMDTEGEDFNVAKARWTPAMPELLLGQGYRLGLDLREFSVAALREEIELRLPQTN